jgi:hypothetical protein
MKPKLCPVCGNTNFGHKLIGPHNGPDKKQCQAVGLTKKQANKLAAAIDAAFAGGL